MVKYNIAMLQAMVSVKPIGPINKIHRRPKLSTLWHLKCQFIDGIHKVGKDKLSLDVHVGYILSKEAFALFSSKGWRNQGGRGVLQNPRNSNNRD